MRFELTILGNNSALPVYGRFPTAQVLNVNEKLYLIDCGEGAQMRMDEYRIKRGKIGHIFISHLHGDHFYGLPGLLTSFILLGRGNPLHVYAPPELEAIIKMLIDPRHFDFEYHFHPIDPNEHTLILDNEDITVHTLPMKHSMPTAGFLFREKPSPRRMRKEQIGVHDIPFEAISAIKAGHDFVAPDGRIVPNHELTIAAHTPRANAYCSETAYNDDIIPLIKEVDLLYHEATFNKDMIDRAVATQHSTTIQAATIAKKAQVRTLMLGHYSARYNDLRPLLEEARTVFPHTILSREGRQYPIEKVFPES